MVCKRINTKEVSMDIRAKWTVQLENNIIGMMGGVALPARDPYDRLSLYVTDSWDAAARAIRFRKFSLETGEELANVTTRDYASCFCISSQYIFAVLGKSRRILKLNREDLHIETVYKKNVPQYADHVSPGDSRTLLILKNEAMFIRRRGYFYCHDMVTGKNRKKRIGGWSCGIEKNGEDTFLIFNSENVFQYSMKTNTLEKLFDTERYKRCARGDSGKIYLLCREPARKTDGEGKPIPYSSRLLVYPSTLENKPLEIVPGILFNHFWLSADEHLMYCYYSDGSRNARKDLQNTLWVYSVTEGKVLFQHTFDTGYVTNVFAGEGIVLGYHWDKQKGDQLTCWEIVT